MGLHVNVGHCSDPCSDAGHRDDGGLLAKIGCCYLGTCIYGPSASLLYLQQKHMKIISHYYERSKSGNGEKSTSGLCN